MFDVKAYVRSVNVGDSLEVPDFIITEFNLWWPHKPVSNVLQSLNNGFWFVKRLSIQTGLLRLERCQFIYKGRRIVYLR